MSSSTSITDFKKPDGTTDWSAYDRAKIANGEKCYQCGGIALLFGCGHRELCYCCKQLKSNAARVHHEELIRCPKCGKSWSPAQDDHYELFRDGTHDVYCIHCEYQFEIETHLQATFYSPPRIKEDPDGEDESEADEAAEMDHGGRVEQEVSGGHAGAGDDAARPAAGGEGHAE